MDKKRSFLDVLVQAVCEKFPHLLSAADELSALPEAERGRCIHLYLFNC